MKEELKSGIVEFDLLIEKFENGEINFVELTSALWNKGYKEGKKQAYSQTPVSVSVCSCGTEEHYRNCTNFTCERFIHDI